MSDQTWQYFENDQEPARFAKGALLRIRHPDRVDQVFIVADDQPGEGTTRVVTLIPDPDMQADE